MVVNLHIRQISWHRRPSYPICFS